ncbi:hypothetical protein, partial [uncultured Alistipes sp.]
MDRLHPKYLLSALLAALFTGMVAAASAPDDSLRAAAIRDSLAPPADTLRELPATDDLGPSAR